MKKVFSILAMFAVALATGFFSADKAEAIPAFARQMQMSCKSCHFQHFPKLNAFGRAFKANGYTDVAVDTINGDWGSSLPVNLNMSWVTKLRYRKSVNRSFCDPCTGTDRGIFDAPDEGVFFIGGRVAEHIGAAIEVAGGEWAVGTLVFGHELESLHTHLGLAVWKGDGPFWGKELFNTGLLRGGRGWENRDYVGAGSHVFSGSSGLNSANGVTLYANHEWFFAALGTAAPDGADYGVDVAGTWRFALTPPQVLGFDWMVGTYGVFGGSSDWEAGPVLTQTDYQAAGVDFQAQGNITEGITLELWGNFLLDAGDSTNARDGFTRGTGQDFHRYSVGFDLGFLNDRLITKFAYLYTSARLAGATAGTAGWDREGSDVLSLAAYYNIRENVSLRPEISWVVGGNDEGMRRNAFGDDTQFILMLMYAF